MTETLTPADAADPSLRARAARFVSHPTTQRVIITLICLNAITLGLETSASVMAAWGEVLLALDRAFLWAFTAEVGLRIFAFRGKFFRDPWGVFDFLVVAIAWLPASGPLSVLRALRVLRVLRLVSAIPSLRTVVEAMLGALPGLGSITLLLGLIFYVFAVMATKLYAEALPEKFGTLGDSLFTLFQLMTLDGWSGEIVQPVMANGHPWAMLFFLPFILLATFMVLNLFIGVIVESLNTLRAGREAAAEAAKEELVLAELRALRAEIAALRDAQPRL
jgi:voltage-gated sodium channel